ncbi:MAG: carboxyl-terminal processing protease [Phycisphaerales bacterium]|jgi:carboxyl-terminal processing protease
MSARRRIAELLGAGALSIMLAAGAGWGVSQPTTRDDSTRVAGTDPAVAQVWSAARAGSEDQLRDRLSSLGTSSAVNPALLSSIELFQGNLAKRESDRAEQLAEVQGKIAEHLATFTEGHSLIALSDGLTAAVELQMLMHNDTAFFAMQSVRDLLAAGIPAAKAAEANDDWMMASELFYRLDAIKDVSGEFQTDLDRLSQRLEMIRMYVPERLWELRNKRRLAEELSALPAYNAYGDDFHTKLKGVTSSMVSRALLRAATNHVERRSNGEDTGVDLRTMLIGGLEAVRVMATTTDLQQAFVGLQDDHDRNAFIGSLNGLVASLNAADRVDGGDLRDVVSTLLKSSGRTVGLMDEALLHEFGNGALNQTDTYTAIIWPDELSRFRRSTQGEFYGVGIQIQLDELMNIEIVTPLEGTPAQRAGVRTGDIIKSVDGISAVGLSLDQAIEVITGPAGTPVVLGMERTLDDDTVTQVEFKLHRAKVDLPSVKGWRKVGPGDRDWDWFIDADSGIGYVWLTGFTEDTTEDFDYAIDLMRHSPSGLQGLILDLRYNPGGLLDQAVSISNRFVEDGLIVRTETSSGVVTEKQNARKLPTNMSLAGVPVVVLVNEGSASASEIVAGAIQAGAKRNHTQALVLGQRSFGKGSVQNVFALSGGVAAMKLTTQYYKIDAPRMIHRRPGSVEWGIEPDLAVEMLPSQQQDMLLLRREADVLPLDENGDIIENDDRPNPDSLIAEGIDLQAQTALVLLQSQAGQNTRQAKGD